MTRDQELVLRRFIRESLSLDEDGWEDPSVVIAKQTMLVDDEDEDDFEDPYDELERNAEEKQKLNARDNYASDNTGLSSSKPLAPRGGSGPKSGRTPGGRVASTQGRVYSAGY